MLVFLPCLKTSPTCAMKRPSPRCLVLALGKAPVALLLWSSYPLPSCETTRATTPFCAGEMPSGVPARLCLAPISVRSGASLQTPAAIPATLTPVSPFRFVVSVLFPLGIGFARAPSRGSPAAAFLAAVPAPPIDLADAVSTFPFPGRGSPFCDAPAQRYSSPSPTAQRCSTRCFGRILQAAGEKSASESAGQIRQPRSEQTAVLQRRLSAAPGEWWPPHA